MAYLALCLLVPLAWSITLACYFIRQDKKRSVAEPPSSISADMYEI